MEHSVVCRLVIGRSRCLLVYLVILHVLMAVTSILLFVDIVWLIIVLLIGLALSLLFQLKQHGWLKGRRAVREIVHDEQGLWTIYFSAKDSIAELELKSSFVTPFLTLIRLGDSRFWRTTTVVVVADAVDAEQYRKLRVLLRDPKTFLK